MILETIQISQNATLTAILHGPSEEMQSDSALRRPAVVICPGGAYEFCSVRESDAPASAFLNMGLQVFILLYSCGEAAGGKHAFGPIQVPGGSFIAVAHDSLGAWFAVVGPKEG